MDEKRPIQKAREKAKLSQSALAKRCGVTQSIISRIELGKMRAGTDLAERLAKTLRLSELVILYPERYATGTVTRPGQ